MGTNYYLRRIPTKEEIAQCHKLVDEQKFEYIDIMNDKYGAPYLETVLGAQFVGPNDYRRLLQKVSRRKTLGIVWLATGGRRRRIQMVG